MEPRCDKLVLICSWTGERKFVVSSSKEMISSHPCRKVEHSEMDLQEGGTLQQSMSCCGLHSPLPVPRLEVGFVLLKKLLLLCETTKNCRMWTGDFLGTEL